MAVSYTHLPHRIQTQSFMMLSKLGILNEQQATKVGNDFFASITTVSYTHLDVYKRQEFVLYYHAWNSDIIPQNVKYIPIEKTDG